MQLSTDDIRWQIMRVLFEHERLKPTNIRTSHGNVQNLAQLKQVMNAGFEIQQTIRATNTKIFKNINIKREFQHLIDIKDKDWVDYAKL